MTGNHLRMSILPIAIAIAILLIVLGHKFILVSSHGCRATDALQLALDVVVHMLFILFIVIAVLACTERSATTTAGGTTGEFIVQSCGGLVAGDSGVEVTAVTDGAVGGRAADGWAA